jgi:hypothetical protein
MIRHGRRSVVEERPGPVSVLTEEFARHRATAAIMPRTRAEIARFFAGLELVPPGLVLASGWRPDPAQVAGDRGARWLLADVARESKD